LAEDKESNKELELYMELYVCSGSGVHGRTVDWCIGVCVCVCVWIAVHSVIIIIIIITKEKD